MSVSSGNSVHSTLLCHGIALTTIMSCGVNRVSIPRSAVQGWMNHCVKTGISDFLFFVPNFDRKKPKFIFLNKG